MHLIYLHGLDSDPSATKASLTRRYAIQHNLPYDVPNLNCAPDKVLQKIDAHLRADSVLIGSSLGGYFATLISDKLGVPAILLNPSIRPDVSFRRFLAQNFSDAPLKEDTIIYRTTGGWDIRYGDLAWFERHRLQSVHPDRLALFLAMDDELLDAKASLQFYQQAGVQAFLSDTGGHRMENYEARLPQIIEVAKSLLERA